MGRLKYAVHAYAWTASWSNMTLDLIDRAMQLGFDVIEIPLMELELVDAAAIRSRATEVGIAYALRLPARWQTIPPATTKLPVSAASSI